MLTWEVEARRILRAELARAGVGYKTLAVRLAVLGIEESEANLSNKIARGKFSFVFFLQCMKAIGIKSVDIDTKIDSAVLEKK
ncbi:MAG: hypothetical protein A0129_13930 [Limnobacter sp. CACIAM 66H1]|uniref:DUF6471 domain-containing protein n=1 Tax=Limnobacter sp. CACIAM 66H1 TaxID=1813033 RepID=UPI0007A91C0D|nr:DUF6471 domain-containing protein [Limnobacter sp. CACIAM 66H1]KYP10254.1 MAG: hypothetical protein A0129_13930 [Limnobacter sp. CACIAM 66H1]